MMKDMIRIFKIILNFIDNLTEEQIEDLLHTKAKLKLIYANNDDKDKAQSNNNSINIKDICSKLESFNDEIIAKNYLISNNLTKANLKQVATLYSIPILSKATNEQIIDKIVQVVIGGKIRFDTLLNTNLK